MGRGENQPRNFLQLHATSLPCCISFLWPMCTKVNRKHLSSWSLELINSANIRTSCNTHLVCLFRTNPVAVTEVKGTWGRLRMHEETRVSLVTLSKHGDGVQTTGCVQTPAVSTRINNPVDFWAYTWAVLPWKGEWALWPFPVPHGHSHFFVYWALTTSEGRKEKRKTKKLQL